MRVRFVIAALLVLLTDGRLMWAADVSDLAVTPGLSAVQYSDIGNDLLNEGDYKGAKRYFDAAIRIRPDLWPAYYNRAVLFQVQKNYAAALQDLNTTIKLEPAFFLASYTRALVYIEVGNYAAALKDLDLLARLTVQVEEPGHFCIILNERARLRATCPDRAFRNGQLAIADARKACELGHWKTSRWVDTLAAAYAEAGDFDSAVRTEDQAINLVKSGRDETWEIPGHPLSPKAAKRAAQLGQQALAGFIERHELYKQHRPYHEKSTR